MLDWIENWEPLIWLAGVALLVLVIVVGERVWDEHSAQLTCRRAQYDAMVGIDGVRYCVQVYGDYHILPMAEVDK